MPGSGKVFIYDKPLIFMRGDDAPLSSFKEIDAEFLSNPRILLDNKDFWVASEGFYISSSTPEDDFLEFSKGLKLIRAAGGIVLNAEKELLMIYRRGFWDLPKGKLDEGENFETAALREVAEETGLRNIKLLGLFSDTWHVYYQEEWILKQTAWFEMECRDSEGIMPQAEEDISEVVWVREEDINGKLDLSYTSVREIVEQFYQITTQP